MNRASDQTGGLTSDALVPSSWVESLPAFSQIQSAQEDKQSSQLVLFTFSVEMIATGRDIFAE